MYQVLCPRLEPSVARNYSLGSTFAADATILDVSPDSEATAQNLPHLLHQMLSPDF